MFIMPAVFMARASTAHQLVMREIEQRHRDMAIMASESAAAAAAAAGGATDGSSGGRPRLTSAVLEAEAFSLEGTSPGARWNKVWLTCGYM